MRIVVTFLICLSCLIAQKQEPKQEAKFQFPLRIQSIFQFGEPFNPQAINVGLGASTLLYSLNGTLHLEGHLYFDCLSIPFKDTNRVAERSLLILGNTGCRYQKYNWIIS